MIVQPARTSGAAARKYAAFTATQSDFAIWTPAAGKRCVLTQAIITVWWDTVGGIFRLFDGLVADDAQLFVIKAHAAIHSETIVWTPPNPLSSEVADRPITVFSSQAVLGCSVILYGFEA